MHLALMGNSVQGRCRGALDCERLGFYSVVDELECGGTGLACCIPPFGCNQSGLGTTGGVCATTDNCFAVWRGSVMASMLFWPLALAHTGAL